MDQPWFVISSHPRHYKHPYRVRMFNDQADAQAEFTQECDEHGVEPTEENFNEGAMHLEDGTSIYLATVSIQL